MTQFINESKLRKFIKQYSSVSTVSNVTKNNPINDIQDWVYSTINKIILIAKSIAKLKGKSEITLKDISFAMTTFNYIFINNNKQLFFDKGNFKSFVNKSLNEFTIDSEYSFNSFQKIIETRLLLAIENCSKSMRIVQKKTLIKKYWNEWHKIDIAFLSSINIETIKPEEIYIETIKSTLNSISKKIIEYTGANIISVNNVMEKYFGIVTTENKHDYTKKYKDFMHIIPKEIVLSQRNGQMSRGSPVDKNGNPIKAKDVIINKHKYKYLTGNMNNKDVIVMKGNGGFYYANTYGTRTKQDELVTRHKWIKYKGEFKTDSTNIENIVNENDIDTDSFG